MDKKLKYITGSVVLVLVLIIFFITKCSETENGRIEENGSTGEDTIPAVAPKFPADNPKCNIFFEITKAGFGCF